MNLHRLAEARSLAYHRAVAARLVADPMIVDRALTRVRGWMASGAIHPEYGSEWVRILALPIAEIARALTDEFEPARALRQSTPFAGVVPPRERWAIWRDMKLAMEAAAR